MTVDPLPTRRKKIRDQGGSPRLPGSLNARGTLTFRGVGSLSVDGDTCLPLPLSCVSPTIPILFCRIAVLLVSASFPFMSPADTATEPEAPSLLLGILGAAFTRGTNQAIRRLIDSP